MGCCGPQGEWGESGVCVEGEDCPAQKEVAHIHAARPWEVTWPFLLWFPCLPSAEQIRAGCVSDTVWMKLSRAVALNCAMFRFWNQLIPGWKPDRVLRFSSLSFVSCKISHAVDVIGRFTSGDECQLPDSRDFVLFVLDPYHLQQFLSHSWCSRQMCWSATG